MWSRVRDSIVTPRNVVNYRNDPFWRILIYVVLFVSLLSTRTIITVIQFDGLTSDVIRTYSENINEIDSTCIITANNVECDKAQNNLLLDDVLMNFYVDGRSELVMQDYDDMYNVVIMGDSIHLIFGNQVIEELPLSDFITTDIDFSLQETDIDSLNTNIFININNIIAEYKGFWAPVLIITEFMSNLLLVIFFVLISSWFLKLRFKVVPFKQLFKMTVYSSTLLYVILVINSLYNLSLFIVILLIIIAVRQNSQLSVELMRRLTKKS